MKSQFNLVSTFILCFVCVCLNATLFGVYDNGLICLDPSTGEYIKVCSHLATKNLQSSNGCTSSTTNTILFYISDDENDNKFFKHRITDFMGERDDYFPACMKEKGKPCDMSFDGGSSSNAQLVSLNVSTCKVNLISIKGLLSGQNSVADMKFNENTQSLYMVFPNPNCIHGSLDGVNQKSGQVINHLADVTDDTGLNYRSAISYLTGSYYSLEFDLIQDLGYALSEVDLVTMNQTLIGLVNNTIGLGDGEYTLSVLDNKNTPKIIGFVTASNSSNDFDDDDNSKNTQACTPSGFYNVDVTSGNVVCVGGNVNGKVVPLSDFDRINQVYYQVIDSGREYYLITYNVSSNTIVYNVECKVCKSLQTLNFV